MKFRCDRADLADRLNTILGIISPSSPKPILADFFLGTEGESVVAEATDLEIAGKVYLHKVEVAEGGEIALPSSRLLSIIKEVPEESLIISSLEDPIGAVIEANGFEFKILGHDPAEFPRVKEPEGTNSISLRRDRFHDALRRVSVASSRDPTRYQLNGVFIEVEKERILFTATDGKRLTNDFFEIENPGGLQAAAIVPNQAVDVFLKVLSAPGIQDDSIGLSFTETRVTLKTKDTHIGSSMIEGMFPNYRAIFPPEPRLKIKGRKNAILSAAKSASLTTDKQTATVLFRIDPENLVLESTAKSIGESRIRIPIEAVGDPMEIRFNPVYFIDAMRTFDDEEVFLDFTDPDKPAVIRNAQNYRHLVMPLVTK